VFHSSGLLSSKPILVSCVGVWKIHDKSGIQHVWLCNLTLLYSDHQKLIRHIQVDTVHSGVKQ